MNIHSKKSNTLIGIIQISFCLISFIRNVEGQICRYNNEGNPAFVNVPVAPNDLPTTLPSIPVNVDYIDCYYNPTLGGSIPSDIGLYTKLTRLLVY